MNCLVQVAHKVLSTVTVGCTYLAENASWLNAKLAFSVLGSKTYFPRSVIKTKKIEVQIVKGRMVVTTSAK